MLISDIRNGSTRQTPGYLQKQLCHLPEETGVQLLYAASYDTWCRDVDTDQISTEQTCGRQTKMESMLKMTYKARNTNICVRETTKVIDIISNVRKKWNGPGQGISTASKTTDGLRVSPLGEHNDKTMIALTLTSDNYFEQT